MQRIYYYKHYTNELLKAIKLDGVPVRGYYAWSLLDNFEWSDGYSEKFGLTRVDFNDPSRKRTPKKSFNYFKKLIQQNGFSETDSPCWQIYVMPSSAANKLEILFVWLALLAGVLLQKHILNVSLQNCILVDYSLCWSVNIFKVIHFHRCWILQTFSDM